MLPNLSHLFLLSLLLAAGPLAAAPFEAGTHYTVIAEEPLAEPVVMEFFAYGCGACYTFEPYMTRLKSAVGDGVNVMHVPVDFGGGFWTPSQELYLVMEALGRLDELHTNAFQFIHAERNPINTGSARDFLARHGVSEEQYEKTVKSFAVHVKEQRYDQLTRRYGISATPTVIINGKYRAERAALGSSEEFIRLVQYLLQNP